MIDDELMHLVLETLRRNPSRCMDDSQDRLHLAVELVSAIVTKYDLKTKRLPHP